jgi:hypothetical protein
MRRNILKMKANNYSNVSKFVCYSKNHTALLSKIFASIFLMLLFFSCSTQKQIKPFTTDGCSCYPDGSKSNPKAWEHCCISHDSLYWKGGSRRDRKIADSILCDCVLKSGYPKRSKRIYWGTRFGGSAWFPTPWRWGYGWKYGRGYKKMKDINAINAVK